MQDRLIDVPGGHINVWHRPGDNPTVLIHGLTGNSRWWSNVIPQLPDERGLISMDARGRARSVEAPGPFDLATMADDVARILDQLGLKQALVAGYSMGAWVAALFGHRHPERVKSLLLVDGGLALPMGDADPDEVIQGVVGPSLARLDIEFESEDAFVDYWKAHPALDGYWEDSMRPALTEELVDDDGRLSIAINPEAIEVSARQITVDPATRNAGASLDVPAHVIVVARGTADQEGGMVPRPTASAAVAANDNLSMEYIEDVNHYTLLMGRGAPRVAAAISSR